MGLSFVVFGMPVSDVLSVKSGDVGRPQSALSDETSALVDKWIANLYELSGSKAKLKKEQDTNPQLSKPASISQLMNSPKEEWTPISLLRKRSSRKSKKMKNGSPLPPGKRIRKNRSLDSEAQPREPVRETQDN